MSDKETGMFVIPKIRDTAKPHKKAKYIVTIGNRVRFVYKDSPQEKLINRHIIYWQYNKSGNGYFKNPDDPKYWKKMGIIMPIGYGITDEWGKLRSIPLFMGARVRSDEEGKFQFYYKNSGLRNWEEIDKYLEKILNRYKKISLSTELIWTAEYFFPKNEVAFMVMPADILNRFETIDLMKLPEKDCVWKGKVTKDSQIIKIHCTLPEWDFRIRQRTTKLENALQDYESLIAPHIERTSILKFMSFLVGTMIMFPHDNKMVNARDEWHAFNLLNDLYKLEKKITEKYINNSDQSTQCGKALKLVDTTAKELWELLKKKEFKEEIERYETYHPERSRTTLRGPYTKTEDNWLEIYSTLKKAYGALAKTPLDEEVEKEHVEPLWKYLEAGSVEVKDTPLVAILDSVFKIPLGVMGSAPGAPSLIFQIVDTYGLRMALKFSQQGHVAAEKMQKRLFGLLKFINGGKEIDPNIRLKIVNSMYKGDMAKGRELLSDVIKKALGKSGFYAEAGKAFRTCMFLFTLVAFMSSIVSDEELTLRRFVTIIGSTANVTLASIGLELQLLDKLRDLGYKFFKVDESRISKLAVGSKGVFRLAILACILSAIISSIDAAEAFRKSETFDFVLNIAGALGSVSLMIGYILIKTGATTEVIGIGNFILLAGIIVTLGSTIWLTIRSWIKENIEVTFESLRTEFIRPTWQIPDGYLNDEEIADLYNKVVEDENELKWWKMSWQAIIPLYHMGFVVYKDESDSVDKIESSKLVANLIGEGEFIAAKQVDFKYVLQHIYWFERANINPQIDTNSNKIPDWLEWVQGTISEEDRSQIRLAKY